MTKNPTAQRSPRGATLSCKSWHQEAALRLLLNNLDPEFAESPNDLIICCEDQRVARDWDALQTIVAALQELPEDQTLFVQAGAPTAIYRTETSAPRLIMVNPGVADAQWWFRQPGNLYGFSRVCAANWFYVGSQTSLQATYEMLCAAAKTNFDGMLTGKLVVTCGLGVVGAAQPLAATLLGAAALGIDPEPEQVKRCVKSGYCEAMVNNLDEALRILKNSVRKREPASVGLVAKCSDVIPGLADRGIVPDLLLPNLFRRNATPGETRAMSQLQNLGTVLLDGETFTPDAFMGEQSEPLVCVALSGNSADIATTDRLLGNLFPSNLSLQNWIALARKHVRFQGLPARVLWLPLAERLQFARAVNDSAARQEFQAPIVLAGIFRRAFGRSPGSSASGGARFRLNRRPPQRMPLKILSYEAEPNSLDSPLAALELASVRISLLASEGLSWAALESFGDLDLTMNRMGGALVADGTPEASTRIDRVFQPMEMREGGDHGR